MRCQKNKLPVHTTFQKWSFRKGLLWRAFSRRYVFSEQKCRLRMDESPKTCRNMHFQKRPDICGLGLSKELFVALISVSVDYLCSVFIYNWPF